MSEGSPSETKRAAGLVTLAARGDRDGVAAALARGVAADESDRWGVTALMHAAARGDLAMIELLLAQGADPRHTSGAGNTALMMAAARGQVEAAERLIAAGAEPDHRNRWGLGARDWAAWSERAGQLRAVLAEAG